jgi:hypothetical protein
LCKTHEDRNGGWGYREVWKTRLCTEMIDKNRGGNRIEFYVEASGFEWLDEICTMSANKDEARRVGMCLHGPAQSLLGDHGQRIGIIYNNEAVDALARRRMAHELGHGLTHTVNAAILFR